MFTSLLFFLVVLVSSSLASSVAPPPQVPSSGYYNVVSDCGADPTGATDSTAAIQACINESYNWGQHNYTSSAVFFPLGSYLVSDTLNFIQQNPGPDDGINICPSRFLPLVAWGDQSGFPTRPVIKLAPNSPGFNNGGSFGSGKPFIYFNPGGVTMNNIFRGIDIDITAAGNAGAVGISMGGAQGSVVMDVTVRGGTSALACFVSCNGAGGEHANLRCEGCSYGFLITSDTVNAQPVPVAVGIELVNQSVSAIVFYSQETLSMTGVSIIVPATASGPIISSPRGDDMSLVDVSISCIGGNDSNQTAISTTGSLYMSNIYVSGCAYAVVQTSMSPIPGPSSSSFPLTSWLLITEYAKGINPSSNQYMIEDVVYYNNTRQPGANVQLLVQPTSTSPNTPPIDLLSKHVWDETTFPYQGKQGVADAKVDCGCKGDDVSDDTAALQACLDTHISVYLPPGRYRVSSTIQMPVGGALVGMGNILSVIVVATTGIPSASSTNIVPLVATASNDDDASAASSPTILAFVGIVIFQHIPFVYALDWATKHPMSLWRVGYETRPCECFWLTAWQDLSPSGCSLPVNITVPKTIFRGLGRVHAWVTDDTGGIVSTATSYRHMRIQDTVAFANETAKLRFYSLNLEHAQSETNAEIVNASFVDIYSIKSEGNLPILWIRESCANISVLAFGGGVAPFWNNFTYPPGFTPSIPSIFRIDQGASGIKFACLVDHGYGANAPYWPPSGGGCRWGRHYSYPGEAVSEYPYSTYPNVTMWNCWYGETAWDGYWNTLMYGPSGVPSQQVGSTPLDKPIYWNV